MNPEASVNPERVLEAYRKGKRDAALGRSRFSVPYSDPELIEAWERGMLDASSELQRRRHAR